MIASQGGAIIDAAGNRSYPGAGGAIGALSAPGKNYGYTLGAGASYHRFTPTMEEAPGVICIDCGPEPPGEPYPEPFPAPYPVPAPTPAPAPTPTEVPTVPTVPTGPGTHTDTPGTPQVPNPILTVIERILGRERTGTTIDGQGPVYIYTPGQSGGGGIDMKGIAILAAVAFGAWFVWKKVR